MDTLEHPLDLKKALARLRNKKLFMQQMMMKDKAQENVRAEAETEALQASYTANYAGPSAQTQEKMDYYRNKITGQKREAKDRWNRFAGTEGGGGRGL